MLTSIASNRRMSVTRSAHTAISRGTLPISCTDSHFSPGRRQSVSSI